MRRLIPLALAAALAACSPGRPAESGAAPPAPTPVARGVVEARGGLLRVMAPRDGVLAAVDVEEGDRVTAGQPLARLDERQAVLELAAVRSEAAERRAEADAAVAKAQGAEREAARQDALTAGDAAPRQDAEQAQAAAEAARADARRAQAAWTSAEARVRLSEFEVGARTIRAPVAGAVVRRQTAPGAFVAAASPLFALEAAGPRIVRAELDESFAGAVRPGASAQITPEFSAGQACVTQVARISDALSAPTPGEEAQARPDQRVLVAVLPLPESCRLPLGQRVLVKFAR